MTSQAALNSSLVLFCVVLETVPYCAAQAGCELTTPGLSFLDSRLLASFLKDRKLWSCFAQWDENIDLISTPSLPWRSCTRWKTRIWLLRVIFSEDYTGDSLGGSGFHIQAPGKPTPRHNPPPWLPRLASWGHGSRHKVEGEV